MPLQGAKVGAVHGSGTGKLPGTKYTNGTSQVFCSTAILSWVAAKIRFMRGLNPQEDAPDLPGESAITSVPLVLLAAWVFLP